MAWETCEWLVAKQRAQEMRSVKLFRWPSVASMAISSVTRLLNGLEQESKMATYSLYFTAVKMVIASFLFLPSLGNFCFLNADSGKRKFWKNAESWALESRIQLKESGIQVPLTKNPENRTWNPESTAWNPESKTVLDFLTLGDIITQGARHLKRFHTCALCSSSSVGCVSSIKGSPLSMFWEIFDLFPEAWFPPFLLRLLTILPVVKQ